MSKKNNRIHDLTSNEIELIKFQNYGTGGASENRMFLL